jgi:hypothetical protein
LSAKDFIFRESALTTKYNVEMQSDHRTINRLLAGLIFAVAFILYFITIAPTASFWDPAERIASAHSLQIPHPPGAPFYLLLGRLFTMFVPVEHVGLSMNAMSAISSALTVMLLYLITIRLIRTFKGNPDSYSVYDRYAAYSGAAIGALAFSVSDSMWFVSVEAETYAMSLFFTALVVWLTLRWSEIHRQPGNERYLILITFLFGIAFGIHLLNLLAIFFVGLIIYFARYEFNILTFLTACAATVGAFLLIFPLTIIQLPSLAEDFTFLTGGLLGPVAFFVLVVAILSFGIYYTHSRKYRLLNMLLLSYTCILIGFSSYTVIYLRSMTNPPIDQNNPDNVERFISYMKREQYGQAPLFTGYSYNNEIGDIDRRSEKFFPRRHSSDSRHKEKYAEYNSDWNYFWSYQIGHMYLRYFNWNFIGRSSDVQDTPSLLRYAFSSDPPHADNPAHNNYWYLPFLLGFLGLLYHFTSDWKRAFSVLALFVATGIAIVIFLNQTPFQPRERDYSYIGSFFAFSIWIGLGASGLLYMIKDLIRANIPVAIGASAILLILIPGRMLQQNFFDHDRSHNYVAPDYAWNLLNSVAPYGILFTNGDNDTFPLWYLQEVQGVRTDVRIVCLSLLNTDWYIDQMKNRWNHEAPPVPISYTDEEIKRIEDKYRFQRATDFWRPQDITIPVDKEYLRSIFENTQIGENVDISTRFQDDDDVYRPTGTYLPELGFEIPVDDLDDEITWYYEGNMLTRDAEGNPIYFTRVQDDLVLDIIRTNNWVRPVYFAITVARDAQLNLAPYLRLEGKAFRLVPVKSDAPFGMLDPAIHGERLNQFRLREVNRENVYFDENTRRMLDNYRTVITRQSSAYMELNMPDSAAYWLRWGEDLIPFTSIQGDRSSRITYAYRYAQAQDMDRALTLAEESKQEALDSLERGIDRLDRLENRMTNLRAEASGPSVRTNISRRRAIENELQMINNRIQEYSMDLSYDNSLLLVVQRIHFLDGDEEAALGMADTINEMTSGRITFPRSSDDSQRRVERIFGS